MTRNDFMKCCAGSVCSCATIASLSAETHTDSGNAEVEQLKGRVDFAQKRFAQLVQLLNQNLDEPTRKKVWESLGREHGRESFALANKYKGDIEGFLVELRGQWVESADYDAAKGTIRIVDRSRACSCPLVKQGLTPADFCDCSLGWQKEVYSVVAGKPVEATIEESVLRGGKRCVFRISIL